MVSNQDIIARLAAEDYDGLVQLARIKTVKVIRYLTGRLYSEDEQEKWRAVRGFGAVVGDREIFGHQKTEDLLRRFFWALNDESGAVPFGIPEAIAEILVRRPEFQGDFLPVLCGMITHEEMIQTGPIERGVIWGLGRVGPPVAACSSHAVKGINHARWAHPDAETRQVAAEALTKIQAEAGTDARESTERPS